MKTAKSIYRRLAKVGLIGCLSLTSACSYVKRGKTESYFDSQLDKSQLQVYRIAIIPNRLPLVLKEPELWRKANWELIAKAFRERGYEVVDYDSSTNVFRQANLPIEDTGSSEEKFALAASQLNADILIMPFYSTSFTGNSTALASQMNYNALVSLQIYSTRDNRFVFRADGDGNSGYSAYSGIIYALMSGISSASAAGGSATNNDSDILSYLSLGVAVVGLGFAISDLMNVLTPQEEWYKRAFTEALNAALEPFFSVYPKPLPIATPLPPPADPPPADQPPADPNNPQPTAKPRETLEDILKGAQ